MLECHGPTMIIDETYCSDHLSDFSGNSQGISSSPATQEKAGMSNSSHAVCEFILAIVLLPLRIDSSDPSMTWSSRVEK